MGRNNEKPPRDSKEVELLPKLERIGRAASKAAEAAEKIGDTTTQRQQEVMDLYVRGLIKKSATIHGKTTNPG